MKTTYFCIFPGRTAYIIHGFALLHVAVTVLCAFPTWPEE
mgnify:CR=1 FL=1